MSDRKIDYLQFECSTGKHFFGSPKPMTRCLVVVRGTPCPGTLTPFGPGSGALKKEDSDDGETPRQPA